MADPTLEDVANRLNALSDGGLLDALELVALEFGLQAEDLTKRLMTTRLKPRTGRLRASVKQNVKRTKKALEVTLQAGSKNLPYIYTHEFGGTIRPKRGKYIRIPLKAARTGAGVDRYSTPLRSSAPDKFYAAVSKKGNLILFDKKKHVPWYVLKRQVKIPKRPTLTPAFKWLEKKMIPELEKTITFALRGD